MKKFFTLLIIFSSFSLFGQDYPTKLKTVKTALDSNLIELEIEGYYGKAKYNEIDGTGYYYGKCITITFKNNIDSTLSIHMPIGSILKCRDTNVQDMIVTKSFNIALYPKAKLGYLIYAMCGEISDGGPQKNIFYDYGGLAEPKVIKIAKLIEKKYIQNTIGQFTMWAVRNNVDSTKLSHYGASLSDLQLVADNINEAGLTAKITEQIPPTKAKIDSIRTVIIKNDTNIVNNEFEINTLTWILFCILGVLIFILLILTIRIYK